MEQENDATPRYSRRHSRRRRAGLLLAGATAAALVGVWVERRPLAGRFVDRELARAGVPARYAITDLGLGRQRLADVVIGDPAHPDLVADWIETEVGWTLAGPALAGVRAGHVRLRGRIVDGRLSLGTIDRLLPASSGKPFALPALAVDVADARLRLETPVGPVEMKLAGAGRLDGGFTGTLAAAAPRIGEGACTGTDMRAALRMSVLPTGRRFRLEGPLRIARIACGGVAVAGLRSDLAATVAPGASSGSSIDAHIASGAIFHRLARAGGLAGTLALTQGGERGVAGTVDLTARQVRARDATAAAVTIGGTVSTPASGAIFDGRVAVADADVSRLAPRLGDPGAGTPAAPLVRRLAAAIDAGARRISGEADLRATAGEETRLIVRTAHLRSASGIDTRFVATTSGTAIDWSSRAGFLLDGRATIAGGGLPTARIDLVQARRGALHGTATIAPYAAAGARLAMTPVMVAVDPGGAARITTRIVLSGPLGDGGRIDGLALPLDLRRDGAGRIVVDPSCIPLAWQRLAIGGLRLDPARLALCPTGAALVEIANGRVAGGARLATSRLAGRLGGTPLTLVTGAGTLALGARGFTLADVVARLGASPRESTLAIGTLTGTLGTDGPAGTFAGGGGRIANVPLVLSAATGTWRVTGGALDLDGAMTVSDAAATPRFRPLAARAVTLRLADGRIAAAGTLREPTTGARVAEVRIEHALVPGIGGATLAVPGITFAQGYQPTLLTPLTYGVVADVRGTVTGSARIDWSPRAVASTGEFGTAAMDLAAAFGPVTGIATTLHFTDLLGMKTAPGQVATVGTVNPGIPVTDGTVRYALAGPTLVQVEGARWPFAGGTLTLEPTLLDFSENRQRRMTFRVDGAAADQFLQQFDFDNLNATGTFDGVLPMIFDESGGRIENGHLAVRPGGGSLAYVGALGQEQLGLWGNLAFQALKSLRYRSLALTLNGPLTGEMVTDVRFAGISQGAGAKGNFIVRRLQRLPFVFNIRIKAPFRGLLDSTQSFYDPKRLIQRNLPQLLEEQQKQQRAAPPFSPPQARPCDEPFQVDDDACNPDLHPHGTDPVDGGVHQRQRTDQADRDQPQHQRHAGSGLPPRQRGQDADPAESGDILR